MLDKVHQGGSNNDWNLRFQNKPLSAWSQDQRDTFFMEVV